MVETRHRSVITSRVVDFNAVRVGGLDNVRVISDKRARSHYFNNIGVEHMLANETARAFANFRASLKEDKYFSSAWAYLGNLYRREGYLEYAEESFLQALKTDEENLIAMSNLANLYVDEDKTRLAGKYLTTVRAHRMKNPYYRYQLARTAFADGDYQNAIDNLLYATRIKRDEDKFCMLLSLSYLMSGDKKEAELWMRKAQERAVELKDRQKYHHKLDLIMEKASS